MPNVSFCIPCYNEQAVIKRCIESIRKEAKRYVDLNYEILVIDNASTDWTAEVARACNVKVISEPNKGIVHARMAGFKAAQYEYIANIDADNVIPSFWLQKSLDSFDEKTVAISGPIVYIEFSRFLRIMTQFFYFIGYICHNTIGEIFQGGNFIVKKSALNDIGGYDTSINFYGEDTSTGQRLSKVGKVRFVPKMWLYSSARRMNKEGVITTTTRYALNYLSITFLKRPITKQYQDIRPL